MSNSVRTLRRIDLSIIIPAFNEQKRIEQTLDRVDEFLRTRQYASEVIVVDDGSTDATGDIVRSCKAAMPRLSLHSFEKNRGKGAAVRTGMIAASGSARLFMDADNSTDISHLDEALRCIEGGADIVVGSRWIDGAAVLVPQPVARRMAGAVFRMMVRTLFRLRMKDSQNGFKAFTASAADWTFGPLQTKGWTFDVEILARAERLGLHVREIPVEWSYDKRSGVSWRHSMRIAFELVSTRLRMSNVERPQSKYLLPRKLWGIGVG